MMKKRLIALFLSLAMMLSLAACGEQPTNSGSESASSGAEETVHSFTDSVGRTVEVPAQIDKVALSGPLAQIAIFALCPDKLVGVSNAWTAEAEQYLAPEYFNMPEIGQLYGGKGELNLETLFSTGAQIVIDVGEPKGSVKEDLDALQEQTGIPFVHITATLGTMDQAYRMLGELLGMETEAEKLATYCASVYDEIVNIANSVEKKNVLYITGEAGLNVIAKGSYHAEVIDLLTNNLAIVNEPSSKGTGNEVDMEQILNWNPDVVIFAPGSIYETVGSDSAWQAVTAIQNGDCYEVPMGPYNWMGFPPSVQRLLGMMWMAKLLYPDAATYDLKAEVTQYFQMFYHCDLTQEQYDALVAHSLGAR